MRDAHFYAVRLPKFMAPELVQVARGCGAGYNAGVDWWALGVSLYQIALGYHPLVGADGDADAIPITVYFHRIASFDGSTQFAPLEALDRNYAAFVRALMHPNPSERLGSSEALDGPRGAMAHDLFGGFMWSKLEGGSSWLPRSPSRSLWIISDLSSTRHRGELLQKVGRARGGPSSKSSDA